MVPREELREDTVLRGSVSERNYVGDTIRRHGKQTAVLAGRASFRVEGNRTLTV